jgi:hypothetical protein
MNVVGGWFAVKRDLEPDQAFQVRIRFEPLMVTNETLMALMNAVACGLPLNDS